MAGPSLSEQARQDLLATRFDARLLLWLADRPRAQFFCAVFGLASWVLAAIVAPRVFPEHLVAPVLLLVFVGAPCVLYAYLAYSYRRKEQRLLLLDSVEADPISTAGDSGT